MKQLPRQPEVPELYAVVEIAAGLTAPWFSLPAKPWPSFVRLSRVTPATDVALFLAVASSYGRSDGPAGSVQEVLDAFPDVLPGGIAVAWRDRIINPSCCCGLEHWVEWREVLARGRSPWTGHDPSPLVELVDSRVQVWSDGAMGEKPVGELPIAFSRSEFSAALEAVAHDLEEFLVPLRTSLEGYARAQSEAFLYAFASRFVYV